MNIIGIVIKSKTERKIGQKNKPDRLSIRSYRAADLLSIMSSVLEKVFDW